MADTDESVESAGRISGCATRNRNSGHISGNFEQSTSGIAMEIGVVPPKYQMQEDVLACFDVAGIDEWSVGKIVDGPLSNGNFVILFEGDEELYEMAESEIRKCVEEEKEEENDPKLVAVAAAAAAPDIIISDFHNLAPEYGPELPPDRMPYVQVYSESNSTISIDQKNYFNQFCHTNKVELWTKVRKKELILKMCQQRRYADLAKSPLDLRNKLNRQLTNYMAGYVRSKACAEQLLSSAIKLTELNNDYIVKGVDTIILRWVGQWEKCCPGLIFLPTRLRRFLYELRDKIMHVYYHENVERGRDDSNLPLPLLSGDFGKYETGLRVYIVLYINRFYTNTINQMCNDIKENNVREVKEHLHLSKLEVKLVVMLRQQLESEQNILVKGFTKLNFMIELLDEVDSLDHFSKEENDDIDKGGMPNYVRDLKRGKAVYFKKVFYSSLQDNTYDVFAEYIKLEGSLPNGNKCLSGEYEKAELTTENLAVICLIGGDGLSVCSQLISQQNISTERKDLFLDNINKNLLYSCIEDCEVDKDNNIESTTLQFFKFRAKEQGFQTPIPRSKMVEYLKIFESECVLPIWESPAEMISLGQSFEVYLQDKINGCEGIASMRDDLYESLQQNSEMMKDETVYIDLTELFLNRFCQRLCKVTLGDLKRYKEALVRTDYIRIPYASFRMSVYQDKN